MHSSGKSGSSPFVPPRELAKNSSGIQLLRVPEFKTSPIPITSAPKKLKQMVNMKVPSASKNLKKAEPTGSVANNFIESSSSPALPLSSSMGGQQQVPYKPISSPCSRLPTMTYIQEGIDKKLGNFIDMEAFVHKQGFKQILKILSQDTSPDSDTMSTLTASLLQMTEYFEVLVRRTFTEHKLKFWTSKLIQSLFEEELNAAMENLKKYQTSDNSMKHTPVDEMIILG